MKDNSNNLIKLREERLDSKDIHICSVDDFCCGKMDILDQYIQGEAFQHNREGDGNTFLLLLNDTDIIIGYYTLRASSLKIDSELWPVIELSRFAIHQDYQRKHLGTLIMYTFIYYKILLISKLAGVKGILVFSDEDAIKFYKSVGFCEFGNQKTIILEDGFRDKCQSMILKIDEEFEKISIESYNEACKLDFIDELRIL